MANIGGTTIDAALSINGRLKNKKQRTVKRPWQNRTTFIKDEISMILLKLLSTVDSQLSQVKEKKDNNTAVLGGLALVIIIEDFYQFPPIVGKFL